MLLLMRKIMSIPGEKEHTWWSRCSATSTHEETFSGV